jgi:hypothetical protein
MGLSPKTAVSLEYSQAARKRQRTGDEGSFGYAACHI